MQLTSLSASEMAHLVRRREISAVELTQAHFDRIQCLNPALNAFVHLQPDRAMDNAHAADERASAHGNFPLLGVPVSIKSCIETAGLPCEAGSRVRSEYVAADDATLVKRLKAAGAIILGNTNCAEMLMAYDTDNVLHGRTCNPYDRSRTAGGSSGGDAAVVASGMGALGVGSDGGGSVRVPAHFCGICGLKPTPGRISATGHFPPSVGPFSTMGVVGPMARSIRDLRLMFSVIAGPDFADPVAADYVVRDFDDASIPKLRIGVVEPSTTSVSAETIAAVNRAARILEHAGAAVEHFRSPSFECAERLWRTLFVRIAGGMLVAKAVAGHEEELSPALRKFLAIATGPPAVTADELLETLIERDLVRQGFLTEIQSYDALVLPVCAGPAFRHGEGGWDDSFTANYLRDMRYSQWFNLLGLPAVSLPLDRSAEGLPIGVQIVAHPFQESLLLAVAESVEKESGWTHAALA